MYYVESENCSRVAMCWWQPGKWRTFGQESKVYNCSTTSKCSGICGLQGDALDVARALSHFQNSVCIRNIGEIVVATPNGAAL